MDAADTSEAETSIREAWEGGELRRAATLTVEHYGGEVFSFLAARLRSPSDASEVFSIFTENLWSGLPSFAWRCSMRTFCYTIARNAANRYAVAPANRGDRNLALSQAGELSQVAERVRTQTVAYMRTEVKDKITTLREQLDAEDQELLTLRVDRNLPWRDLAVAMTDGGENLPDEELARVSARLRKRFQAIKDRLKQLAREEGLL